MIAVLFLFCPRSGTCVLFKLHAFHVDVTDHSAAPRYTIYSLTSLCLWCTQADIGVTSSHKLIYILKRHLTPRLSDALNTVYCAHANSIV
jgi:hypothetical protein